MTALRFQTGGRRQTSPASLRGISAHNFDVWMLFPKRLVYTLQGLWYLFYILSETDRSEVQIDSKEVYLTLWCHQPHPGQSLNPQAVVEFGRQDMESGWIFQRVLSLVVQKHSCRLDYQDKFLVLKHSSLTVSCVCFSQVISGDHWTHIFWQWNECDECGVNS